MLKPAIRPPDTSPCRQQTTPTPSAHGPQQTKRILGIMPNFSSVSADTKLPPQTAKEKFILAGKNSFDYSSFLIAAIQAGIAMERQILPGVSSGRRRLRPILLAHPRRHGRRKLHGRRPRSRPLPSGQPLLHPRPRRLRQARLLRRHSRPHHPQDNGNRIFNFSEVVGSGAAAGRLHPLLPHQYRTWTKVGQKWLTSDIIDCRQLLRSKSSGPTSTKRSSTLTKLLHFLSREMN